MESFKSFNCDCYFVSHLVYTPNHPAIHGTELACVCVLFVAVFAGLLSDFLYAKSTSGNNKTNSGISQMSVTLPTASIKLIANWKPSPYTWHKRIHNQWMWHAIRNCQWDSFFPHFGWLQKTGVKPEWVNHFTQFVCYSTNNQLTKYSDSTRTIPAHIFPIEVSMCTRFSSDTQLK